MDALLKQIITAIGYETDPLKISRKLRIISQQPQFHQTALNMALTMTTNISKESSKSWREAARTVGRGNDVYAGIMESLEINSETFFKLIRENADLITNILPETADWITNKVQEESLKGRRASDIAEEIYLKYPDIAHSKAQLIARTEVSKTQTALIQSKCETLGLDWYIWRTSQDARVRKSHGHMEGVLVKWSNPPNPEKLAGVKTTSGPYHAGCFPNCRCYPEPVVAVELVVFPCSVYFKGNIRKNISRLEFEKIKA